MTINRRRFMQGTAVAASAAVIGKAHAAVSADEPAKKSVQAQPKNNLTAAEKIGILAFSMAAACRMTGHSGPKATFNAMVDLGGYGELAGEFAAAQKHAASCKAASAGGIFVPPEISSGFIDVACPFSTFLRGGSRRVALISGEYNVPGWAKLVRLRIPTPMDINMANKVVDSVVPIGAFSTYPDPLSQASREWAERSLAAGIGSRLDRESYYGSGGDHRLLGITRIEGIKRVAAQGGPVPTVEHIEASAEALEERMARVMPIAGSAWVMAPRTFLFLQEMRDAGGKWIFPSLLNSVPTWRDRPVFHTTEIPTSGGVAADESEILLVHFGNVFLGEGAGMSLYASAEASYVKDGVIVSAFQNNLIIIKASIDVDVGLRYIEAVAILEGVRWGA